MTSKAAVAVLSLAVLCTAGIPAARAQTRGKKRHRKTAEHRLGIVVFQFDDGTVGHYTHAFPILEKHGLKGSFGVVTGNIDKPGRLTAAQIRKMHKAGHEIHDHTLHHDAAFWGNPENQKEWGSRIEQSLGILKKLGIKTRGWNQPGGKGQGWSEELRKTLAEHYDYAAGRVGLRSEQYRNIHWHLKDDPLSLGRGGIASWGYNGGKGDPTKEAENIKTKIADGVQQGLVVIPLWHVVKDEDKTAWALEEICKFVRDNNLPTMVMADAVKAITHPRDHFKKSIEQMPNPTFSFDIDEDGRPDGYQKCRYAPANVKGAGGGRVVVIEKGTDTWIYGPEPGRTALRFAARSGDNTPRRIAPVLTFTEVNKAFQYKRLSPQRCDAVPVGAEWRTCVFPVDVGEAVDRVSIAFDVQPPGPVYVCEPSWRLTR